MGYIIYNIYRKKNSDGLQKNKSKIKSLPKSQKRGYVWLVLVLRLLINVRYRGYYKTLCQTAMIKTKQIIIKTLP